MHIFKSLGMSNSANIFQSPIVRWGMPAITTAIIVAVALLVIQDQTFRLVMLGVAVADLLVTPQILKRAAQTA